MNKFGDHNDNKKLVQSNEDGPEQVTSSLALGESISPNAKVLLKIHYKKSGDIVSKEMKASDFAGKTKEELAAENYEVESLAVNSVTLIKTIDSYTPNKYILGIKDNCFAIYKTDENGNMYIENSETDITDIEIPTEGDYELLIKGSKSFQFDTREAVEEKLGEYDS
jgi:hypothetical protein